MFPYKIEPVEENLNRELMNDFHGERYGFVTVGPKKWCLPQVYEEHAEKFYTYNIKEDDVWLITFPRSGLCISKIVKKILSWGNILNYSNPSAYQIWGGPLESF